MLAIIFAFFFLFGFPCAMSFQNQKFINKTKSFNALTKSFFGVRLTNMLIDVGLFMSSSYVIVQNVRRLMFFLILFICFRLLARRLIGRIRTSTNSNTMSTFITRPPTTTPHQTPPSIPRRSPPPHPPSCMSPIRTTKTTTTTRHLLPTRQQTHAQCP